LLAIGKAKQINGQLVFSWSVNPGLIVKNEEKGSAVLLDRLKAAQKCQKAGYAIGLHFDPIVNFSGWEKAYFGTIKKIFQQLDPEQIIWISMGALRFNPNVKKAALEKYAQSKIYYGELLPGMDGKLRYFRPLRVKMFQEIYKKLSKAAPKALIYLCMESPEVWQEVLPQKRMNGGRLAGLFS
jgi:spore photoproduct lyase